MDTLVTSTNDGSLSLDTDFPIFNPETESVLPVYTFTYPYAPGAMAGSSNDHDYLLLFYPMPSNSLVFFNGNKCVSVTLIKYGVYDICWSNSTNVFIVATAHHLYEYDPLNSTLSESYIIEKNRQFLWTITCNSTDLFIVHAPNTLVCKRQVKRPFTKKQQWSANDILCEHGDQCIGSIRIDERQEICILISNHKFI